MDVYRIVIPSRKRAHLMGRVFSLLPTATVTVEDNEMDDYRSFVPSDRLVSHPLLGGITPLRNWILQAFPEPCIVMADDDFAFVKVLGGKMRTLKDPSDIRRLIENQVQIACDLDIGVFLWNPGMQMVRNYHADDPISFTKDCWGVFGLRGQARQRGFDPKAIALEDVDLTLQALREDRIVLCDMQFHFDVGANMTLQGGNLTAETQTDRMRATDYLRAKWGRSSPLRPRGKTAKRREAVPRRS